MSTNGIPTGIMRFKMGVMKKSNTFTYVAPPNLITRCVEGMYEPDDTIHQPGYIRYIDANGDEILKANITTASPVITIYAREIIEYRGINFVTCIE